MKFLVAATAIAAPLASAFTVASTTNSQVPVSDTVDYVCIFRNEWSGQNHPNLYPSDAHWSPPVLAAHDIGYSMWAGGAFASPGVQVVAETGSTSALEGELASAGVDSFVKGETTFNRDTQTQTFNALSMGPNNSRYVSTITMVVPSPDWISGFYDFNAVNEESGTWYREFVIDTLPWDAGTEDGEEYSLNNPSTDPQTPITQFTPSTVPSTGVFLNQAGDDVLPVVEWTCTLQQPDPIVNPVATTAAATTEAVTTEVVTAPLGPAFNVTSTTNNQVPSSDTIDYVCVFQNEWSGQNHPNLYPSDAHWSPPVLAAYDVGYTMWSEGMIATAGVQDVAETGSTSALEGELASAGVDSFVKGVTTFNRDTQTQTFDSLSMGPNSKNISTISMVVPSPDWFSGFYNFNAVNEVSGTWYREFVIDTLPWDAGTEDGDDYSLSNPATDPQQSIFWFTPGTVPSTGVFLNQAGDDVLPVVEWTCTLQQPDPIVVPIATTTAATTKAVTTEAITTAVAPTEAVTTVAVTIDIVKFAVTSTTDSQVPSSETVDYVCTFQNEWSGQNHPNLYPSGVAQWSPPVLVSHGLGYTMWADGASATPGVEDVAETGSTTALEGELGSALDVGSIVKGVTTFNSVTQSQTFNALSMGPSNRYFTTISMMVPSPDWFSGFYNFNAVNEVSGTWYREFVIDTPPWDVGTEDGDDYSLSNPATDPQQSIFRFTPGTVPSTGVFLNQAGDEVLPVAEWTCQLQQPADTTVAAPVATTVAATTEAATTAAVTTQAATTVTTSSMPEPVLVDNPLQAIPTSCDELSCPTGTECGIRSAIAQCFPRGPYVNPPWWDRIAAMFDGIPKSLKNCSRCLGVAPISGTICAPRPKTCYFGNQDCATVGPHPEIECVCIPPPEGGWGKWQCLPDACPATE